MQFRLNATKVRKFLLQIAQCCVFFAKIGKMIGKEGKQGATH
jgi:hypothetical protein